MANKYDQARDESAKRHDAKAVLSIKSQIP